MKLDVPGRDRPRLRDAYHWRELTHDSGLGYYDLKTEDIGEVPVRLFVTGKLLDEMEDGIYPQIVNASRFPGVKMVVITPDCHIGYGVPIGSVILTDAAEGAIAMGPVGFDIGCGMVMARSEVPFEAATPDRKLDFNRRVVEEVAMGAGESSDGNLSGIDKSEFQRLIRGGAEYYAHNYGNRVDRSLAERQRIPVHDSWKIPWGDQGRPERGVAQLGSLGGGNHFIELQKSLQTNTLFVQVHTGSRGFGHGLATNYFNLAKAEKPDEITQLDLGYFTPDSVHYQDYLDAVAAGANFAIINRLVIFEAIARAFKKVFHGELQLVYEISHNLVQKEWHPDFGDVWVHRKGATRALPAGHPQLVGTNWEETGHPILIPGSNKDFSYILKPEPGAVKSGFSVNHGAGRRISRGEAKRSLSQSRINKEYREAGILVNTDGEVPLDEASPCYKSSEEVIAAVTSAGLATIEHQLWPLASLKAVK